MYATLCANAAYLHAPPTCGNKQTKSKIEIKIKIKITKREHVYVCMQRCVQTRHISMHIHPSEKGKNRTKENMISKSSSLLYNFCFSLENKMFSFVPFFSFSLVRFFPCVYSRLRAIPTQGWLRLVGSIKS